ncbi:serine protease [Lysinibacillus xylanilyticus]|uniref:S1C family serine protease n=1 Tax=Lysinibacillus xylanilyticus TaxID=582475 RepID=UPI002B2510EA|nr:serine protease [Lysinibacillus xylanilyticus]MEB2298963.1 serine protease [Lysinibacillus xylanilyticus]
MSEIHKTTTNEELTEEELIELVLAEQQKALAQELEEQQQDKKPKKQRPIVKWIVWSMAFVLFLNTFALIFQIYSIPALEFLKVSARLSAQEDIKTYKKAVVEISTGSSKGTGFVISSDGLIVTNAHVVEDAQSLFVVFPEEGLMGAKLVESYPDVDLALLQVTGDDLPSLSLAKNPNYSKNEHVYFIGNPLAFTGIANEGTLLEQTSLEDWQEPVMMMDAPVYRGNSGSPVINADGEVIGIVFATAKKDPYGRVGLFIPVQVLQRILSK